MGTKTQTYSQTDSQALRISVVIPNWNGIDLIEDCLEALRAQTCPSHIIVVDNGSVDGSDEVVRTKFPEVELLAFPDNAGFAGGVNRGIRPALAAGADYIALMNNDAVADPTWLERLVAVAEADRRVGAVAAKILTQDGKRIDSTGDFYSVWGFAFPRGRGETDAGQYDTPALRDVFACSGGASLYRATMLQEIGLFDERFFAYFEDVDIAFRGQLAGWQMRYEPTAAVRHFIGGTSTRMVSQSDTKEAQSAKASETGHDRPSPFARYQTVKNFAYIYTKNMPGWLYWKYLPRFWAAWAMMLVSDLKRGLLASNLRAQLEVLRQLPHVLADRRRIQRARKVPVRQIDQRLYHSLPPLQRLRFERLGLVRPGHAGR